MALRFRRKSHRPACPPTGHFNRLRERSRDRSGLRRDVRQALCPKPVSADRAPAAIRSPRSAERRPAERSMTRPRQPVRHRSPARYGCRREWNRRGRPDQRRREPPPPRSSPDAAETRDGPEERLRAATPSACARSTRVGRRQLGDAVRVGTPARERSRRLAAQRRLSRPTSPMTARAAAFLPRLATARRGEGAAASHPPARGAGSWRGSAVAGAAAARSARRVTEPERPGLPRSPAGHRPARQYGLPRVPIAAMPTPCHRR